jgi:hypothetical protein
VAGYPQGADRLDRAGARLRDAGGGAGQHRPSSRDRVDRVGLAPPVA